MNIKKSLLVLLTVVLIFSCNKDEILEQNAGSADLTADISQYDNSNLGLYKGTFTTNDGSERGLVEVKILLNAPSRATLTLVSGAIYNLQSTVNVASGQDVANLNFVTVADYADPVRFDFSVTADGTGADITSTFFSGLDASILIAKETSRAPVVPITGTYLCTACGTHPNLGTVTQTFNMVYTGNGSDDDTIETEMTLGATVYTSLAPENSQPFCAPSPTNPGFNDCPISGTTMVTMGGPLITWTGTHTYDTVGDCSQVSGSWTYDSPVYGSLAGDFISDAQCLPPVNDLCTGAIAVACGDTVTATTAAATNSGEPGTFCATGNPNGAGVWYVYTGTGGNAVTVETCGSTYDTKLWVYSSAADCTTDLVCLDGNDDACQITTGQSRASRVSFNDVAGTTYYIYVAGFNGATGSLVMNVSCSPLSATVGDLRAGGVVFWVDPADNRHGLVCAFSDYVSTREWGCYGTDLPSVPNVNLNPPTGPGAEIGDGTTNTNGILLDCPTAPAALAARSYGPEWFLPSVKELNEMYVQRATLEAVPGFVPFQQNWYWSSTEFDNFFAWLQDFFSGYQSSGYKNIAKYVRAVRAF